MTDISDRASDLETEERQRVLNSHLNRVKEPADEPGFCNDCGNDIPADRIKAHPDAVTCLTCQDIREKRGRHELGNR